MELDLDTQFAAEMKVLLDTHEIWRLLNSPSRRWSGYRFRGKARAVAQRLTMRIDHPIFEAMHVNWLDTEREWSHGHSHECPFVSYLMTGGYESKSWLTDPCGSEQLVCYRRYTQHCIVPFAETQRWHSLKTFAPTTSIVLTGKPEFPRFRSQDVSLPTIEIAQVSEYEVSRLLGETIDYFMSVRLRHQ